MIEAQRAWMRAQSQDKEAAALCGARPIPRPFCATPSIGMPQSAEVPVASPVSAGIQLTRLSSVLNGLENGAHALRAQAVKAREEFKTGQYHVDPVKLSQRIIRDCLRIT